MWDPVNLEASVYASAFTDNRVSVYYYEEADYTLGVSDAETPANIPIELMIGAKINERDIEIIRRYADAKCSFTADDGTVVFTEAILLHGPLQSASDPSSDYLHPNTVKCRTPVWNLRGRHQEQVRLDISLNG